MPYCPKCGKEISADAAFCNNCGASLRAAVRPPESVPPAPCARPGMAFALSLIAGVLILINAAMFGIIRSFMINVIPRWVPSGAPHMQAIWGLSIASRFLYTFMIVGVIFGVIIIASAIMLYQSPGQKDLWGVVILVFSILSITIGGGFMIGFILGIVGGALAVSWKPPTT